MDIKKLKSSQRELVRQLHSFTQVYMVFQTIILKILGKRKNMYILSFKTPMAT